MGETKELNIKNRTYYFYNDIIDIKNFHSNLLKIDKKYHEDIDIYYIGYVTIKKIGDCENIHCVNPLYLTIYPATGYFWKKYGERYLTLDPIEKYVEAFSGILSEIETINGRKVILRKKTIAKLELILTIMYH